MGEVTLESQIAASHAKKQEIEDTVSEGLAALPGVWKAQILISPAVAWWLVSIQRPSDGFRRTMLVDPKDQTPEAIAERLQEALREVRAPPR